MSEIYHWAGTLSGNQLKAVQEYFDNIKLGDLPPATATALVRLSDPKSWEEISFALSRQDVGLGTSI